MFKRTDIRRIARIEEGVPLWGCAPGSPAALAGLRYGDIVLSVDGNRTRSAEEYVAAKREQNGRHVVVFRRGAETLSTTIEPGPSVWPDVTAHLSDTLGAASFWVRQGVRPPTHLD